MSVIVAYDNGKFDTFEGKEITIQPIPPNMVVVKQENKVIFVANIKDIRYIKHKQLSNNYGRRTKNN